MVLERVGDAERKAGPDCRAEIKRHPRDLVLPLGEVVRHDPTRGHVTQALEWSQMLAAVGNLGLPSAKVHRDVDRDKKSEIAGNSDNGGDEHNANRTVEVRQQSAQANADRREGDGPYRIF